MYLYGEKKSVSSLEDLCVRFICKNLKMCTYVDKTSNQDEKRKWKLPFKHYRIMARPAQKILFQLCKRKLLTDENMDLFRFEFVDLVSPVIRESKITQSSLKVLKEHKLHSLSATNLENLNLNGIVSCLGEQSVRQMFNLNVSGTSIICENHLPIVVILGRFKSLYSLNVSRTEIKNPGLQIIVKDLVQLRHLDISRTNITDISPLRRIAHRLNGLVIHRLELTRLDHFKELLMVLIDLKELRYLDVSDRFKEMPRLSEISRFCSPETFPHITHLDVSGNPFGFKLQDIESFISNHQNIRFLGLASWIQNNHNEIEGIKNFSEILPTVTILGDRGDNLLLNTLNYCKDRTIYLNYAFQKIFEATSNVDMPKPELLSAVLTTMRFHMKRSELMLAGTAVVYNLTRSELSKKLPSELLNKAVRITLLAMEKFPDNHQLHKNCFLTLCSDTVLHEAKFNCKQCCELVFNGLIRFDDVHMKRMGVAIISILAAEIKTSELEDLAREPLRVRCLLIYVAEKCLLSSDLKDSPDQAIQPDYLSQVQLRSEGPPVFDTTFRFTLSALWNLTDECFDACIGFVNEGGLRIYEKVLKRFSDQDEEIKIHVYTKCLGLLNNIAEIEKTGSYLMNVKLISFFLEMIKHSSIQISYFAAGIIANLSCIPDEVWIDKLGSVYTKDSCCKLLGNVVCDWMAPQNEMVAYRSFGPFETLVVHEESRLETQLWAVWAINHILSKKVDRYRQSLKECEKLCQFLKRICDKDPISLCLQNRKAQTPTDESSSFYFPQNPNYSRSQSLPQDQYSYTIRPTLGINYENNQDFNLFNESLPKKEMLLNFFRPKLFENVVPTTSKYTRDLNKACNRQSEEISSLVSGAVPSSAGPDVDSLRCAKLIKHLSRQILDCISE